MTQCKICLLEPTHPFGIYFSHGVCSGCLAFSERRQCLPIWNAFDKSCLAEELVRTMGSLPEKVVVPFDADGETWFVLDVLIQLGIRPVVIYFNSQYHDDINFSILSACQENYDADFIGFSLPKKTIQFAISEEFSVGSGHCRNVEIFARHISALYAAEYLGIEHIIAGPHQQSEIVGSHSFVIKNQLKQPSFNDIIIGEKILPQVKVAIHNVGSMFSTSFDENIVSELLEKVQWHYLSDYIFWDSESINYYYGNKYNVKPRVVNGFGPCWQASSSPLKLEFFDLLRLINTGSSKIDSYLSREIRFERINKIDALEKRRKYLNKKWDIKSIADFLGIPVLGIEKALELYLKGHSPKYLPKFSSGGHMLNITSHSQSLC